MGYLRHASAPLSCLTIFPHCLASGSTATLPHAVLPPASIVGQAFPPTILLSLLDSSKPPNFKS